MELQPVHALSAGLFCKGKKNFRTSKVHWSTKIQTTVYYLLTNGSLESLTRLFMTSLKSLLGDLGK